MFTIRKLRPPRVHEKRIHVNLRPETRIQLQRVRPRRANRPRLPDNHRAFRELLVQQPHAQLVTRGTMRRVAIIAPRDRHRPLLARDGQIPRQPQRADTETEKPETSHRATFQLVVIHVKHEIIPRHATPVLRRGNLPHQQIPQRVIQPRENFLDEPKSSFVRAISGCFSRVTFT